MHLTSQKYLAILFAVILFSGGVPASALPSSQPLSLTTSAPDPYSILASWLEPADDGGQNVTSYRIEYESTGIGNWTTFGITNGSTSTTITSLSPDTDYNVRVYATNIDGESPASSNSSSITQSESPTDSDGDGIPDSSDSCPSQPETFNGFEDADGCPDSVPIPAGEFPTVEFAQSPAESFNIPAVAGLSKVDSMRNEASYTEIFSDGNPNTLDIYKTITADKRLVDFNGKYSAPYYVTEDANMVQVETPEGSFVFDKPSCAITFYNGERITGGSVPVIGSDSFIFRGAVVGTDNWVNLTNLNNASCNTEVFTDGTNIEVRGTKIALGEGEVKIRYIKLAGELLKPQLEITNLNPAWTNHKLSILETLHVPDTLKLGDTTYNLPANDGTFVDRAWIQAHGSEIIEITDKVHYDVGLGWDLLWGINVLYEDGQSKLVFDYSNTELVILPNETLILDPLYGTNDSAVTDDYIIDSDNNGVCDIGSSIGGITAELDVGMEETASGSDCYVTDISWGISSIHKYANVTDITFGFEIFNDKDTTNAENVEIRGIDFPFTELRTAGQRFTSITGGTLYFTSTTEFDGTGTNLSVVLGATANSDLESDLQAGTERFAIGLSPNPATQSGVDEFTQISSNESGTPKPTLTVTYTIPVPDPPTLDVTFKNSIANYSSTTTNLNIGTDLGTYYGKQVIGNVTFSDWTPEPLTVSGQSLASHLRFDGFNTGLLDFKVGNVTTIIQTGINQTISTDELLIDYEFDNNQIILDLLPNAVHLSSSLGIDPPQPNPTGIAWNNDGTKLFTVGTSAPAEIQEYTCTTAFDVSSCSDASSPLDISSQETQPQDLGVNNDGTKFYVVGNTGDTIDEWGGCSPAYDVSTCTFNDSLDISAQDGSPNGIDWNLDGTKMFMAGNNIDSLSEYTCTAFDVSTCTLVDTISITSESTVLTGISWNTDGSKIYLIDNSGDLYAYSCGTVFDTSTCKYYGETIDLSAQSPAPEGIVVIDNGIYIIDYTNDEIDEYSFEAIQNQATIANFGTVASPDDSFDTYSTSDRTANTVDTFTSDRYVDNDDTFIGVDVTGSTNVFSSANQQRLEFDIQKDGTLDKTVFKMSNPLGDTGVIRFKLDFDTFDRAESVNYRQLYIGVSNTDQTVDMSTASQYGFGVKWFNGNSADTLELTDPENSDFQSQVSESFTKYVFQTVGIFYVEIQGTSPTTYCIGFYSDSAFLILIEERCATRADRSDYNYFFVSNVGDSQSGTDNKIIGSIDDLNIYENTHTVAIPDLQKTADLDEPSDYSTTDRTADYSNNFATDNWDASETYVFISGGVLNIDSPASIDVQDADTDDLTSIDDTNWVLRFKHELTTLTQNTDGTSQFTFFGLSAEDHTVKASSSQKGIYFGVESFATSITRYAIYQLDGEVPETHAPEKVFNTVPTQGDIYYIEMERLEDVSVRVSIYSDSAYSELVERRVVTIDNITGLQYVKAMSASQDGTPNGVINVNVDDFELYDKTHTIAIPDDEKTPDFSDSFTTVDNFIDIDTHIDVDTVTNDRLDFNESSQDTSASAWDLGAGAISDTQFAFRFAVHPSALTAGASGSGLRIMIGLSDSDQTEDGFVNQDFIGIEYVRSSATNQMRFLWGNDEPPTNNEGQQMITNPPVGVTQYVEVRRLSASDIQATVYSDSGFTTVVATGLYLGIDTDLQSLRYFKVMNYNGGTPDSTITGWIDDLEIYNSVSDSRDWANNWKLSDRFVPSLSLEEAVSVDLDDQSIRLDVINLDSDSIYNDVGTANISDTWTLRWKMTIDELVSQAEVHSSMISIGLDSLNVVPQVIGHYSVGISSELSDVPADALVWRGFTCVNINKYDCYENETPTGAGHTFTNQSVEGDIVYFQISKVVNDVTFCMYSDSYTTAIECSAVIDATGVTGLRYAILDTIEENTSTHDYSATVSDLEFFDGVRDSREWGNNWTSVDETRMFVDLDTQAISVDAIRDGTNNGISYDLGTISDESFTIRGKVDLTTYTKGADVDQIGFYIGLSDESETGSNNSQDVIALYFTTESGGGSKIKIFDTDGAVYFPHTGSVDATFTLVPTVGDKLYWEILRLSPTDYRVTLYSDSGYTDVIESEVGIVSATTDGLRYLKINNLETTGANDHDIQVTIDDVEFYNGVATMGANADGTNDGSTTGEAGIRDQGYNFVNSENDFIDTGVDYDLGDTGTVSAWVQVATGIASTNGIIYKGQDGGTGTTIDISMGFQDGTADKFNCFKSDGASTTDIAGTTTGVNGVWYHVVCAWDSSTVRLYVNGVEENSGTSYNQNEATNWLIGSFDATSPATNTWNGLIDDVLIFDRKLTQPEITTYYNIGRSIDAISGVGQAGGTVSDIDLMLQLEFEDDTPTADAVWGLNNDQVIEDFTTYTSEAETDSNWPSTDETAIDVNISTDVMDWTVTRGTEDNIAFDLGVDSVNDSVWTLRFKGSIGATTSNDARWTIGFSDSVYTVGWSENQDMIGFMLLDFGSGVGTGNVEADGGTPSAQRTDGSNFNFLINTPYYFEMVRTSSTTMTTNVYSDPSYSTVLVRDTYTIPSTIVDLRYLKMINKDDSPASGTIDVTVDNIEFWNGKDISLLKNQATLANLNPTVTYTEDYTSCTTDTCDGDYAYDDNTYIKVDTTDNNIEINNDQTTANDDYLVYDTQLSVSEDFTLRFKSTVDTSTLDGTPDNTCTDVFAGMSDTKGDPTNTGHDYVGFRWCLGAVSNDLYLIQSHDESITIFGSNNLIENFVVNDVRYLELTRNNDLLTGTSYLNSDFTDIIGTVSIDASTTTDELEYLYFGLGDGDGTADSDLQISIDDVNFYNNFVTLGETADGTNNGATAGVIGKHGEAFSFDGIDDVVIINTPVTVDNSDFTISAWVNKDVDGVTMIVMASLGTDNEQEDFAMRHETDNTIVCYKRTDNTTNDADQVVSTTTLNIGQWYHIACVYDDSVAGDLANLPTDAWKIYVNGALEDNTPADNLYGGVVLAGELQIGDENTNEWNGQIDDVRIYHRALTDNEISTLAESFQVSTGTFADRAHIFYEFDDVTPTFVPTSVSNLEAWYDGNDDSKIIEVNGFISQWTDSSGNGNHLVQSTETNKPMRVGSTVVFEPVASDNYLDLSAFASGDLTQPTTIFIVLNNQEGQASKVTFDSSDSGKRHVLYSDASNFHKIFSGLEIADTTAITDKTEHLTILYNGASSTIRVDGVETSGLDAGTQVMAGFTLGASSNGVGEWSDTTVSEILIYNADVSDSDRDNIEAYLVEKWDLVNQATITNYNPTPTFEDTTFTSGWTISDSSAPRIDVNTVTNVIDFDNIESDINRGIAYDLTSLGISDTIWTLQFEFDVTTKTLGSSSDPIMGFLGLSSEDQTSGSGNAQDWLGMYYRLNQGSFEVDNFFIGKADGTTLPSSAGTRFTDVNLEVDTYYIELSRQSATELQMTIYSDANYSIPMETDTLTIPSGVNGLKFLKFMNSEEIGGAEDSIVAGTIDNIKFYNNFAVLAQAGDGINKGVSTGVAGVRGEAYSFTTDDYVSTDYLADLTAGIDKISIGGWLKFDTLTTQMGIFDFNDETGWDNSFQMVSWTDDNIYVYISDATPDYCQVDQSDNGIVKDQWFHIFVVYDGTGVTNADKLKVYVNSVEATCSFTGGLQTTLLHTATAEALFGRASNSAIEYLDGDMDDWAVFINTILTPSQIKQLYNNGDSLDVVDAFSGANSVVVYPYLSLEAGTEHYDWRVTAPTSSAYTDDFTSDTNWVKVGTEVDVEPVTNNRLDWTATTDGNEDSEVRDLGTVLPDDWVLEFKFHVTTATTGGDVNTKRFWFGLDSIADGGTQSAGHDFLGLYVQLGNSGENIRLAYRNGANIDDSVGVATTTSLTAGTDQWIRIQKVGDTAILRVFSDSSYTTQTDSVYLSTTGLENFRYLKGMASEVSTAANSSLIGYIDDVSIYTNWDGHLSKIGGSIYFDGLTYYEVADETIYDIEFTDPFSFSVWVNLNDGGNDSIFFKRTGTPSGYNFQVNLNEAFVVSILQNGSNFISCSTPTDSVPLNQWTHLVLTSNGMGTTDCSGITVYIDDTTQSFTDTSTGTLTTTILNNIVPRIGTDQAGGNDFGGLMDDLRFYKSELTPLQVTNLFAYDTISGDELLDADVVVGNTYAVRSATVNQHGQSGFTEIQFIAEANTAEGGGGPPPATCVTSPAECGNAPTLIKANGGINLFALTWDITNGTAVTGYRVENSTDSVTWEVAIAGLANMTTTYTNATAGLFPDDSTMYWRVFGEPYDATNSFIEGRTIPAPEIQNTTKNYPDTPIVLLAELDGASAPYFDRFDIEFDNGTMASGAYDFTGGDPIDDYRIRAENVTAPMGWVNWVTNSTVMAQNNLWIHNQTALLVNSTWNIQISLGNDVDWSAWSANLTQSTTFIPSTPVTSVLATPASENQIDQTWVTIPDATDGGSVTKDYGVRYVNNTKGDNIWNDLVSNSTINVGSGGLNYNNHTGLYAGHNNTYQIREGNIAGWSAWSSNATASVFEFISASLTASETHSGDAIVVNGTWTMDLGVDTTVTAINATSHQLVNGTDVLQTVVIDAVAVKGQQVTIPFMYMVDLLANPHALTLRINIENSTGIFAFNSTILNVTPAYDAVYSTSIEGNIQVNYTHVRLNNGNDVELRVNRIDPPFKVECNFRSELFGDGEWQNLTVLGHYNVTESVSPTRNVYIQCYNDDLLFTTVSFGETNATLALVDFTDQLGTFFGVPIPFLFVIFLGAIFTGRSAPTGIIFMTASIGVMGLMGYFPDPVTGDNLITATVWGMLILVTALGLFMGKRFF